MYFAESQIFDVFDFQLITGDKESGISEANCALISESYSRKYFGDSDPLGKTINVDKEMSFVVTGIFRDIPENSHLKFDILLSWPNLLTHYGADIETSWGDTGFFTYFILKPGVNPSEFEEKLKPLVERDFGEALKAYKLTLDLKVQPLTDIHLNSSYMQEMEFASPEEAVNTKVNYWGRIYTIVGVVKDYDQQYRDEKLLGAIFGTFAILAIFITCLGIFGLTSFMMLQKTKEISIRRVTGSNIFGIIVLFSKEFIVITLIAFLIAVPVCYTG